MATTVFRVVIHDRRVEVGCYGTGKDWVCRLTDSSAQPKHANDDFFPAPDLGFAWFREVAGYWSASALVNQDVFRDAATVSRLLERISERILGHEEHMVSCIEFVVAKSTATWDGELGPRQGRGGWAEDRWWRGKRSKAGT